MSTTSSPLTPVPQLHIDTSRPSPTLARVVVIGEVDLATAPLLRHRLMSVLHDRTPAVVEVDLTGVSLLDCAGLGALVAVRNAAVHTGQEMRVSHLRPIVRRMLELTGLFGVLAGPVGEPPPESDEPAGASNAAALVGVTLAVPAG